MDTQCLKKEKTLDSNPQPGWMENVEHQNTHNNWKLHIVLNYFEHAHIGVDMCNAQL